MANLTEVSQWENVIRQLENGEAATGGADGLANVQAKQLANRTQYLKSQIGNINNDTALLAATGTGLNHNGIYRGKNWGTFTSLSAVEQFLSDHGVSTGLFKDLYLGDYFVLQDGTYNKAWEIAGFDMFYNCGDTALTTHHLNLIPRNNLRTSKMNDTNDTTGGYYNSYMHKTVIPEVDTNMAKILGSHLLTRRAWLTDAVNKDVDSNGGPGWTGASSSGNWYSVKSVLMNEMNIWGAPICSSNGHDNVGDPQKMPIFNFRNHVCNAREWFWLRCVVYASAFADAGGDGGAGYGHASAADGGVRPLICVG